jgi:hypothetical protein
MTSITQSDRVFSSGRRPLQIFYTLTLFLAALTGFGQMPIYKRYYLSDIPGFGWLADFYATRFVHYAVAAILLLLMAYALGDYLLLRRRRRKLTASGYLRACLLGAIVATGILFVIKNFPVFIFSAEFIIGLNLAHLGLVMIFLLVNLYCLVTRKGWTTAVGPEYVSRSRS